MGLFVFSLTISIVMIYCGESICVHGLIQEGIFYVNGDLKTPFHNDTPACWMWFETKI